ncbi:MULTISPECIES: helix-turn-helix transcriptional regulator [unclassified Streptomyces]|jgi:DNA-binding NarL/FixJ family response regulator|uniref:helix-turn-helix transcriptional regulator n=1 Tax=unclassified Streptomyces TaxID=2593676 RepID=UPI0009BED12A|nr:MULTISPECIES: helix-turn-helix transcriptional regulator [unclassified Streptomyces]MCX4915972.1 helix-turn-helix transcriptional regulator [Streptomyces sp. NBC_00687]MCX5131928.1 helix-turn-helix transcriptional regulator [Streptomyces sp. NBC_00340]MCX5284589.1 helix-turn-helix transcriptional regulator [Streptomyces sp. NBC_00198]NEB31995.1 helix-turn-helix transcriptional regulator [Streptomyces sp. SID14446]OQQ17406.1 helix-turn-helix transcriptional regulator [Streptomyces sp. M41(20
MFRTLGGGDLPIERTNQTHPHPVTELCDEGARLYTSALSTGRIARAEATAAPCLLEFALLRPDPDDSNWLRPVPPSVALTQRLHPIEREIQERRRRTIELTESFEPFMMVSAMAPAPTHAITVLEGIDRINAALDIATSECHTEMLTIQPGGRRSEHILNQALERDRPLTDRGVRIRTLYQHTVRYSQGTAAYMDRIASGKIEIRTLEELIERLIICDGTVAFIPASDDNQFALELRHPGLVRYLTRVFEQLWRRATPLREEVTYESTPDGITGVQRSIAKLLIEGHVDEAIARRLGMNVRTCRAHIAKLAASLGSGSRAQLGFLIAQSGILEQDH